MFSDPAVNIAKFGISEGMKVADLGAGSGFYSFEAARKVGKSGRVYAIDVQKIILDRIRSTGASQGLSNIEVLWGDIEKIGGTKLRDTLVDRVIASNVLFQLNKPDEFCLEIKRILKPKGKVLVIDWSEATPLSPSNVIPATKAQLIFEKAGFKLESSFGAGEHHYGLIFLKS